MSLTFESELQSQFFRSLEICQIKPKKNFIFSLTPGYHRFSTEEDKGGKKSGAYFIYTDGRPRWGVQDFRQHEKMNTFVFDTHDDKNIEKFFLPPETKEEKKRRHEREKAAQQQALQKAKAIYNSGEKISFFTDFKYLRDKKVKELSTDFSFPALKISSTKSSLLVPLLSPHNWKIQSLQFISLGGQKGIAKGTALLGSCFPILHKKATSSIVCEGLATGLSLAGHLKKPASIFCAMSAWNIKNVAKNLRGPVFIAADADEVGEKVALACVKAGLAIAYKAPPISGYDWNDFLDSKCNKS